MFSISGEELLRVAVVSVCAYAALVLILRIAGKRSLAKLNAFDFVVTVAFGSTLATVLLSKDVSLAEGILAFAMLAALQYLVSRLSVHSDRFKDAVRSAPTLIVENGSYLDHALVDERVTRGEVEAAIRKHGIGDIRNVAAVVIETDGSFSVIGRSGNGDLSILESVRRIEHG